MKVVQCNRGAFVAVCKKVFELVDCKPDIAEVGVLKGNNAKFLYDTLQPNSMYLIDPWDSSVAEKIEKENIEREWVAPSSSSEFYYGGPLNEQSTFDKILLEAREKFEGVSNVQFIVAESRLGLKKLNQMREGVGLDYLYLDGAHDFESVFEDLMNVRAIMKRNSIIQMNDCCFSENGMKQNLGVLEAVGRFIKFCEYRPVCLTASDFTDLILVPPDSDYYSLINKVIEKSNLTFVEVPEALMGALKVKNNGEGVACISFT